MFLYAMSELHSDALLISVIGSIWKDISMMVQLTGVNMQQQNNYIH